MFTVHWAGASVSLPSLLRFAASTLDTAGVCAGLAGHQEFKTNLGHKKPYLKKQTSKIGILPLKTAPLL